MIPQKNMFLGRGERWQRAAAGPGGLMRACVLFMYVPSRRTCVVDGRSHHVAKEGIGCTLQVNWLCECDGCGCE